MSQLMQKYYDRAVFTEDEKWLVWGKTKNQCCHCGKVIFVGYGMTVDHFIPLAKGGSNSMVNLIPLCSDCNNDKGSKLYKMDYIVYMKDKYRKELEEYLESYLQVTDFVQRNRWLAYDEYKGSVSYIPPNLYNKKKMRGFEGIKVPYTLKLATLEDVPKLTEYLIRYLKKNDTLDSEAAAKENIYFWLTFGCLYYVEANGQINFLMAITVRQLDDPTKEESDKEWYQANSEPNIFIFPMYKSQLAYTICADVMERLPQIICEENNLIWLPYIFVLLNEEPMLTVFQRAVETFPYIVTGFTCVPLYYGEDSQMEGTFQHGYSEEGWKTIEFLDKFDDSNIEMLVNYFEKYQEENIGWMINSIFSMDTILANPSLKELVFKDCDFDDEEEVIEESLEET